MPYTSTLGVLTHDTNGTTIVIRRRYTNGDEYIDCEFAREIADQLNNAERVETRLTSMETKLNEILMNCKRIWNNL